MMSVHEQQVFDPRPFAGLKVDSIKRDSNDEVVIYFTDGTILVLQADMHFIPPNHHIPCIAITAKSDPSA